MNYINTAIGRRVLPEDMETQEEDSVLRILYSFRCDPSNPHHWSMSLETLYRATSGSIKPQTLERLTEKGFIETDVNGYRITLAGAREVLQYGTE